MSADVTNDSDPRGDDLSPEEQRLYEEAKARMPSREVLMRFVRKSPPISEWESLDDAPDEP